MANGEIAPSMPSSPESSDGDKKSRAIRVPLPLRKLAAEHGEPKPAASTRILDILNEQRVREQIEASQQKATEEKTDKETDKDSKRRSKKEDEARKLAKDHAATTEQSESPPTSIFETSSDPSAEVVDSEVASEIEADPSDEVSAEQDLPLAEGAVELPLEGETEITLSERRVRAWNRARQQSPPTAPMSEVGQPGVLEADETLPTEQTEVATEQPFAAELFEDTNPSPMPLAAEDEQALPRRRARAAATAATPSGTSSGPRAASRGGSTKIPAYPGWGMPPLPPIPLEGEPDMAPTAPIHQPETRPVEVQNGSSDFWPGVVVGAGVEHIRHRNLEKRMDKEQDAQKERIDELEAAARRDRLEQNIAENELMRTEADARYREAASPVKAPSLPSSPVRAEQSPLIPIAVEQSQSQPQRLRPEAAPAPIVAPETEEPEAEADSNPLERRHIETSSWHAIEVDDRTGHVAEDSHITYGEAFTQEQRAERQPKSTQQTGQEQPAQDSGAQSASGVPSLPQPWQATPTPPVDPRMMGAPAQPSAAQRQAQRMRNSRPPLVQSGADAALWVGLIIVVTAVVVALSL